MAFYKDGFGMKIWQCRECNSCFSREYIYEQHMRQHKIEQNLTLNSVSELVDPAWGKILIDHCQSVYSNLSEHIMLAASEPANHKNTFWHMSPEWWREIRTHCLDSMTNQSAWLDVLQGQEKIFGYPVRTDGSADIPNLVYVPGSDFTRPDGTSPVEYWEHVAKQIASGMMTNADAFNKLGLPGKPVKPKPVDPSNPPQGYIGFSGPEPMFPIYDEITEFSQKPDNPYTIKPWIADWTPQKPTWHWEGKPIVGFQGYSGLDPS